MVLALVLFVSIPAFAAFPRDDVVILENGDRFTGDVKELQRGVLRLRTDYVGNVYIQWIHIASVHAEKDYQVEMDTGERYFGELRPGGEPGKLGVVLGELTVELDHDRVVRITRIKHGFIRRLEGNIDIGVNFRKSQSDLNITASAKTLYRTRAHRTTLDFDSSLTDRVGAENIRRVVVRAGHYRFLSRRWTVWGLTSAETNDELNLDLRATLGAGGGRSVIQSNRVRLNLLGGATVNRERYVATEKSRNTGEALLGFHFDRFILGDLGNEITVDFMLLPSLTEGGRIRTEFNFSYRHEIIVDLSINFSGWHSYDSENPTTGVAQDDYGIVTSFGWAF
jgi:hypothetical protein